MNRRAILLSVVVTAVFLIMAVGGVLILALLASGDRESFIPSFGEIAVVEIEGPILGSTEIVKKLRKLSETRSVHAVVLRIDSPGGGVAPSQEIHDEVVRLAKKKKVVASMGAVAASGGYYIACAAHKIVASPGTITGSIGVIMESFGMQELLKWAKLENRVMKTGPFKDVGNPFREMTNEERVYLQAILENMYGQFKAAVAEGRKMDLARVEELAQGKIYTGQQALQNGLVDNLGNLYDAIDVSRKLAGLSDDAGIIWPQSDESPFAFLTQTFLEKKAVSTLFDKYFHGMDFPLWFYSLSLEGTVQK